LMTALALLTVCAYFLGSLSTAIIVCKVLGVADPREVGSRNPGATNVLRYAGKGPAAATLLGDAGKGVIPVVVGHALGITSPGLSLVALAAFLGHLYPVYYAFRGGKGVATFIGVNLAFDPWIGLTFIAVWLSMALIMRYSSLAALTAAAATPFTAFWLGEPPMSVAVSFIMVMLMFWRHRTNISKLISGTEKRIGQKA
jgi:acyl phosphate:glycerol-3-phosphate acyltransferase